MASIQETRKTGRQVIRRHEKPCRPELVSGPNLNRFRNKFGMTWKKRTGRQEGKKTGRQESKLKEIII